MSSAGRALVIEDEEELRALFAHVLKSAGFTVCEAAGGEEGIDKARRFEPNLIVLDLRLPGVSGFTVARVVRALERERVVVIVAVSGLASESLYHEALEAGCDAFFRKPVEPAALVEHGLRLLARPAPPAHP